MNCPTKSILYVKKRIFLYCLLQNSHLCAVKWCRRRGTSGSDFYLLCHKVIYCLLLASAFPIVRDITDTRIHTHSLHSPWMQCRGDFRAGECMREVQQRALRLYHHPCFTSWTRTRSDPSAWNMTIYESIISSSQFNFKLLSEELLQLYVSIWYETM